MPAAPHSSLVRLPAEMAAAIRSHAQQTYPNECCGILLGVDGPDGRQITTVQSAENAFAESERHHRFTITPATLLKAEKHASAVGLTVLGFYHSHPDHPAEPSEYDRTHAWPFYSYVIVSVRGGVPAELRSWRLQEETQEFEEQEVRSD